jgi:AcrR family transcriptional regulator
VPETDRIAALAAELFHEHGITATGVDALSKAAGISKRTLYERFGSKDGLIVAAYDSLDLPVFQMLTTPAEAASDDPREQLERLFVQLEAMVQLPQFRGCPFVNASSELADPTHPAHQVVRRHKDRLRRWILKRTRTAGATHPDRLSRQLMLLFAGAQSQALVQRSPLPVRDARRVARTLVEAAIRVS